MEIRKREAKVFLLYKQIEDLDENLEGSSKENVGQANAQQVEEEKAQLERSIAQQ